MVRKPSTVLVAEDDTGLLRLMRRALERAGYRVLVAQDGPTALELVSSEELALVLLDIALPRLDGLTLCRYIREFSDVYIILIAARPSEEGDVVRGLDLGADDCLARPFSVDELLARVRAVLRRGRAEPEAPRAAYICDDLVVNFAWHCVMVGGREVPLTPTEYRLLATLASYPGLPLTQRQLVERVWGPDYAGGIHALQVNIGRLRRKLEPDPQRPRYILTKPGVGYCVPRPTAERRPTVPLRSPARSHS
jgi:DNA-binding response OmpR family regulator